MIYDGGTKDYFDTAPDYSPERADFVAEFMLEEGEHSARLLAAGVGTGEEIRHLRERLPRLWVVGADISLGSLVALKKKSLKVKGVCSTVSGLPFDSGSFDVVTCISLLHHLVSSSVEDSRQIAIQSIHELVRVLRPGGFLFVYEPTFSPQWFSNVVFVLKSLGSKLTKGARFDVPFVGNFGAPVTAFFAPENLEQVLRNEITGSELESLTTTEGSKQFAFGLIHRTTVRAVIRKS